jgi:hypothetical protein
METGSPTPPVPLAPPGAGLPKPELFVARFIFGWFRRSRSRADLTAMFEEERARILRLARPCDAGMGTRRTLIQRLPGLEDSSRDWSVSMTLEHLRIVNEVVGESILSLSEGIVPERVASTAAVKPSPEVDASAIEAFDRGCDRFQAVVAAISDLRTSARYAHPWFGPLDAAGWHAMATFHMRLHRKQVEAILAAMKR